MKGLPNQPETPYIVWVDTLHNEEYPFCPDPDCPCHDDPDLQADLGDALASGRVSDGDAGLVYYGERSINPAK